MDPIRLTEFGEKLNEFGEDEGAKLSIVSPIGVHIHDPLGEYPGKYYVDLMPISDTHNSVYCRKCGKIGNPVSINVTTYAELRRWCAKEIQRKKIAAAQMVELWSQASF